MRAGQVYAVADEAVLNLKHVSEVLFDLLMKCYLPETADLGRFVTDRLLQTVPGVKDTFTIIAFKAFSEHTSV
jgi:DNA-binding Lrp family transcriptional regulator